jgi:hypothetical protein
VSVSGSSGLEPMVPAKARLQRVAAHLAPTAAEGPRSRARIAVVGLGWWTTAHHMPDLDDNPAAEVVAAVEIVAERRDEVGAKYGIQTFETVDDMVAAGIELDGVVIASPHVLHFSNALACVKAGWHVLVEKPMTTSAAEADELLAAAAVTGVSVSVNNTGNFNRATDEAAELVSAGTIGTVQHVVCTMVGTRRSVCKCVVGSPSSRCVYVCACVSACATVQQAGDLADLFGTTGMDTASPHRAGDRDEHINYAPLASTWADPKRAGGYGWYERIRPSLCLHMCARLGRLIAICR